MAVSRDLLAFFSSLTLTHFGPDKQVKMVCLKIRFCRDNRENRDSAHVNLNKLWARICWENTAYLRKFFPYNEAWWRTSRRIKLRRLSLIYLVYTALPVPVCLYNCRERRLNLGRQGGAVRSVRIYNIYS